MARDRGIAGVFASGEGILPAVARLGGGRYLLKAGRVGGPDGEPGSLAIGEQLVAAVVDAAVAGEVTWETDPDFGYEVAAVVPRVAAPEDGLLLPRLLYTRADRVYEHAAIVPRVRAEVAALIADPT